MKWPGNKQFAFTIFDDTDAARLEDVILVYDFLAGLGFRTTKSVWVFDSKEGAVYPGVTCENPHYLSWLKSLQSEGFEIGLHNVTAASSQRERIVRGLDLFHEFFGTNPMVYTNHVSNVENIYWGTKRLTGLLTRTIYRIANITKNRRYYGDEENSPYFWGDLCKERIRYVRNFVFNEINTLKVCPIMPYHDTKKPYVNYWFASADGGNIEKFLHLLDSIDVLQREGGACIIYTHFANGFVLEGKLDQRFVRKMQEIAERPGWFMPVGTLLDWLKDRCVENEDRTVKSSLRKMEFSWLMQRFLNKGTH